MIAVQKEGLPSQALPRDALLPDDGRKHRKPRSERQPDLSNLIDFLEERRLIDYDRLRNSSLVELQAGEAPISAILQERCNKKNIPLEVYAVDQDPEACAAIRGYRDIPYDHVIEKDTIGGFDEVLKQGTKPYLVTLTSFYPQQDISMQVLAVMLAGKLSSGARLLVTCADDVKDEFNKLMSGMSPGSPFSVNLKLLSSSEDPEYQSRFSQSPDQYMAYIEVSKPAGFVDLSKYARPKPVGERAETEYELSFFDAGVEGLSLFTGKDKPKMLEKPIEEICEDEIPLRWDEYSRNAGGSESIAYEKFERINKANLYHDYGYLSPEEIRELEDILRNTRGFDQLNYFVLDHLKDITERSAEQIADIIIRVFPENPSGKKLADALSRFLAMYVRDFQKHTTYQELDYIKSPPISAALTRLTTSDTGSLYERVKEQVLDQIPVRQRTEYIREDEVPILEADKEMKRQINKYIQKVAAVPFVYSASTEAEVALLESLGRIQDPVRQILESGIAIVVQTGKDVRIFDVPPVDRDRLPDNDIFSLTLLGQSLSRTKDIVNMMSSSGYPSNMDDLQKRREAVEILAPLIDAELSSTITPDMLKGRSLEECIRGAYQYKGKYDVRVIVEKAAERFFGLKSKNNIFSPHCEYHRSGGYYVSPQWLIGAAMSVGMTREDINILYPKYNPPEWYIA